MLHSLDETGLLQRFHVGLDTGLLDADPVGQLLLSGEGGTVRRPKEVEQMHQQTELRAVDAESMLGADEDRRDGGIAMTLDLLAPDLVEATGRWFVRLRRKGDDGIVLSGHWKSRKR